MNIMVIIMNMNMNITIMIISMTIMIIKIMITITTGIIMERVKRVVALSRKCLESKVEIAKMLSILCTSNSALSLMQITNAPFQNSRKNLTPINDLFNPSLKPRTQTPL
jgi:hypothetical protein